MARAPKPTPRLPDPKVSYFILDKTATSIAGKKLQVDQETIELTEAEASFYTASGAISTAKPASDDVVAAAHAARNAPPPAPAEPAAPPPPAAKAPKAPAAAGDGKGASA